MVPDVVQLQIYGHRQGQRTPLLCGWKALELLEDANTSWQQRLCENLGSLYKADPSPGTGFSCLWRVSFSMEVRDAKV